MMEIYEYFSSKKVRLRASQKSIINNIKNIQWNSSLWVNDSHDSHYSILNNMIYQQTYRKVEIIQITVNTGLWSATY